MIPRKNRKQRARKTYTYNGETLDTAGWCARLNISPSSFSERLRTYNNPQSASYSPYDCFEKPRIGYHRDSNGKIQTLHKWAEDIGVPTKTLRSRLSEGKTLDEALVMPYQRKTRGYGENTKDIPIPEGVALKDITKYPDDIFIRELKRRAALSRNAAFMRDVVITLPSSTLIGELRFRRKAGLI